MSYQVTFCPYTIGEDAYQALPAVCAKLGRRIVVIGGHTAREKAMPALREAIAGSGLTIEAELWHSGKCSMAGIEALAAQCREIGPEILLGVGGGKAIDTAKGVADLLSLPVVTVPTIAATCAGTTALSVVYTEQHTFDRFLFFPTPPAHCLIHTGILGAAPTRYLRAGMGDTVAKHFECTFSARNDALAHSSALGREISALCYRPLLEHGRQAMEDCAAGQDSPSLREALLANIVTTGLVSLLVEEDYNGAVAHSLCYGLSTIPAVEEQHLHGDIVAYGVLVQLMLDGNTDEARRLRDFLRSIGTPTCLKDFGLSLEELPEQVVEVTLAGDDMRHLPFAVTGPMLRTAIAAVETL
ncbi:MAG: iron-containing alcohol dehydrogenase family protein [Clostridia bacterium]|nr:iron-containing alcohol dehydrogenase family protein [Clostridia bacterium]